MSSQYKIVYRYEEDGLTKEDEVIVEAQSEPTEQEARQYLATGPHKGTGSISIVSVAPWP